MDRLALAAKEVRWAREKAANADRLEAVGSLLSEQERLGGEIAWQRAGLSVLCWLVGGDTEE